MQTMVNVNVWRVLELSMISLVTMILGASQASAVALNSAPIIKLIPGVQWQSNFGEVMQQVKKANGCNLYSATLAADPENKKRINDDNLLFFCQDSERPGGIFRLSFNFKQRKLNQILIMLPLNKLQVETWVRNPPVASSRFSEIIKRSSRRATTYGAYAEVAKSELAKAVPYDPARLKDRIVIAMPIPEKQVEPFIKRFTDFLVNKKSGAAQYESSAPATDTRATVFFNRDAKTGDYGYLEYAPMK